MPVTTRLAIPIPAGFVSREVASFIAQLNDQSRRLAEDTRGLTPADLAWQPAPGMNTIGMLLAHIAIVEVWWTGLILEDLQPDQVDFAGVIGIGRDDDGMPMAANDTPPAALAGKDLAYFDDALARARTHLELVAGPLTEPDLTRTLTRVRPTGEVREIDGRWALYHMLEHFAGHYGQVLLLKHARRAGLAAPKAAARGAKKAKKPARKARKAARKAKRPARKAVLKARRPARKSARKAKRPARKSARKAKRPARKKARRAGRRR